MTDECDGARSRIGGAGVGIRDVAPRAIRSFEALQALDQLQQMWRFVAEVFVCAESDKGAVSRPMIKPGIPIVTAVSFTELFNALQQCTVKSARHSFFAYRGPAPGAGRYVDEIEFRAATIRPKEKLDFFARHFGVERLQAGKDEHRVVKIRSPVPVQAGSLSHLATEKVADAFG